MRKIISFILFLAIIFNMNGIFIVFKLEQVQIRKAVKRQIKAGIPEDELHLFVLTQKEYAQLDWVRKNIEFRMRNSMFDIVRSHSEKDSVYLYCVNDTEEAVLFARLDKMISSKIQQDSKNANHPLNKAFKLLKQVFFNISQDDFFSVCQVFEADNSFSKSIFYTGPFLPVHFPPPETV